MFIFSFCQANTLLSSLFFALVMWLLKMFQPDTVAVKWFHRYAGLCYLLQVMLSDATWFYVKISL